MRRYQFCFSCNLRPEDAPMSRHSQDSSRTMKRSFNYSVSLFFCQSIEGGCICDDGQKQFWGQVNQCQGCSFLCNSRVCPPPLQSRTWILCYALTYYRVHTKSRKWIARRLWTRVNYCYICLINDCRSNDWNVAELAHLHIHCMHVKSCARNNVMYTNIVIDTRWYAYVKCIHVAQFVVFCIVLQSFISKVLFPLLEYNDKK